MDETKVCISCGCGHHAEYLCKHTFPNGNSKICTKNCTHNGLPLNHHTCKHSNNTPTVLVSKVGSDRSIPLVENIVFGIHSLGIQHDTGCQLSLISRSALQTIPASMYSLGNSNRVRVLTYAGEGRVILTTKVKLRLCSKVISHQRRSQQWFWVLFPYSSQMEDLYRNLHHVSLRTNLHPAGRRQSSGFPLLRRM